VSPFEQIHLSWQEDTATSLTVTWFAPDGRDGVVEYRPDSCGEWRRQAGAPVEVSETRIHQRATLRGLAPNTAYAYRVVSAEGEGCSETFVAHTAPKAPPISPLAS
jgi:hypothetical protein